MSNCCKNKNNVIHNHYHHHHPVGTVVHKITDSVTEQKVQKMIEGAVSKIELPKVVTKLQVQKMIDRIELPKQCPVTEQRVQELIDQTQCPVTEKRVQELIELSPVQSNLTELPEQGITEQRVLELIDNAVDQIKLPEQQQGITEQRVLELIDQIFNDQPYGQTKNFKQQDQEQVTKAEIVHLIDQNSVTEQRVQKLIDQTQCPVTEKRVQELIERVQFNKEKRTLHYVFNYPSFDNINNSYLPTVSRLGHPYTFISGNRFTQSTTIKILSHIFDQDKVHGDELVLQYGLQAILKDGNTDVQFMGFKINTQQYRHGNKNYYTLNKSINIFDLFGYVDNIAFINIIIARTSDVSYGTESVIDVLVEY